MQILKFSIKIWDGPDTNWGDKSPMAAKNFTYGIIPHINLKTLKYQYIGKNLESKF